MSEQYKMQNNVKKEAAPPRFGEVRLPYYMRL